MSDKLTIRAACVEDAAIVATLLTEFHEVLGADGLPASEAYLPENVQVPATGMARRLEQIAEVEKVFVAQLGSEAAGLACLRLAPYVGQDVPYAELTQVYVRPQFQRSGIGAALVAAVERMAVEAGATCVHVITGQGNAEAQAFYRAQGYAMPGVEFEKHFSRESSHA